VNFSKYLWNTFSQQMVSSYPSLPVSQTPPTLEALRIDVLQHLPDASVEQDNSGQVIIYTGLQVDEKTGRLIPLSGE
jgi:hypothetical protein